MHWHPALKNRFWSKNQFQKMCFELIWPIRDGHQKQGGVSPHFICSGIRCIHTAFAVLVRHKPCVTNGSVQKEVKHRNHEPVQRRGSKMCL